MTEFVEQFHFLRPWWLLLLLVVIGLGIIYFLKSRQKGVWQSLIDPEFQAILLKETNQKSNAHWPVWGSMLLGILLVVAMAGPTWQEVKVPAEKNRQATVVVMDLSLSMLADDLKPNRITRVRYKLENYLKTHNTIPTGMVAYAASAHILTPISEDPATLLALLPTLNPIIMPAYGSEPLLAMEQAEQLFEGSHVRAKHILWITDDIEPTQTAEIRQFFEAHNIQLSMLIVGTQKGGAIPVPDYGLLKDDAGQIIVPKVPDRLFQFAKRLDANYTTLSQGSQTLSELAPISVQTASDEEESKQQETHSWLDEGALFIGFLLPLFALAYRRGWLFSSALILPMGLFTLLTLSPTPSFAKDGEPTSSNTGEITFLDVFKSPNQQGYEKWQIGDYAGAENRFESPEWKGASFYRMGDYKQAAKSFALDESAKGQFNLGNAYAKMGAFEKAKTAYEKALVLDPKHQASAENLKIIQQILDQKNQQSNAQDNQTSQPNKGNNPSKTTPPPSNENESKQEKGSDGNTEGNENGNTDDNTDKSAGNKSNASQNSNTPSDAENGDKGNKDDSSDTSNNSSSSSSTKTSEGDEAHTEQKGLSGKMNPDDVKKQDQNKQTQDALSTSLIDQNKQQRDSDVTDENSASGKLATLQGKTAMSMEEKAKLRQQENARREAQQANQHWLEQIPDEPGLFLQRKFDYQYQNEPQSTPSLKTW